MKKVVLGLGILTMPMTVLAESDDDISVGASIGIWEYEEQGIPDFSPYSLELSAAYSIHQNFDVHANLGVGITEEKEIVGAGDELDLKVDNYFGLYLKPNIDIENHSIYALIGYSKTRLEAAVNGFTTHDTSDGVSYGVGASFGINESSSITTEWRQQADSNGYEVSGFTVGYSIKLK